MTTDNNINLIDISNMLLDISVKVDKVEAVINAVLYNYLSCDKVNINGETERERVNAFVLCETYPVYSTLLEISFEIVCGLKSDCQALQNHLSLKISNNNT